MYYINQDEVDKDTYKVNQIPDQEESIFTIGGFAVDSVTEPFSNGKIECVTFS